MARAPCLVHAHVMLGTREPSATPVCQLDVIFASHLPQLFAARAPTESVRRQGCAHAKKAGRVLGATFVCCLSNLSMCSFHAAVCDEACLYGECAKPQTCACYAGWEGEQCNVPKCEPGCKYGSCLRTSVFNSTSMVFKHSCHCEEGWEGDDCGTRLSLLVSFC